MTITTRSVPREDRQNPVITVAIIALAVAAVYGMKGKNFDESAKMCPETTTPEEVKVVPSVVVPEVKDCKEFRKPYDPQETQCVQKKAMECMTGRAELLAQAIVDHCKEQKIPKGSKKLVPNCPANLHQANLLVSQAIGIGYRADRWDSGHDSVDPRNSMAYRFHINTIPYDIMSYTDGYNGRELELKGYATITDVAEELLSAGFYVGNVERVGDQFTSTHRQTLTYADNMADIFRQYVVPCEKLVNPPTPCEMFKDEVVQARECASEKARFLTSEVSRLCGLEGMSCDGKTGSEIVLSVVRATDHVKIVKCGTDSNSGIFYGAAIDDGKEEFVSYNIPLDTDLVEDMAGMFIFAGVKTGDGIPESLNQEDVRRGLVDFFEKNVNCN